MITYIVLLLIIGAVARYFAPLGPIGTFVTVLLIYGVFVSLAHRQIGYEDDEEIELDSYIAGLLYMGFAYMVINCLASMFGIRLFG